jgi:hypothetical protein
MGPRVCLISRMGGFSSGQPSAVHDDSFRLLDLAESTPQRAAPFSVIDPRGTVRPREREARLTVPRLGVHRIGPEDEDEIMAGMGPAS